MINAPRAILGSGLARAMCELLEASFMSKRTFFAAAVCGLSSLPVSIAAQEGAVEKLDAYTLARVILPADQAKNIVAYRLNASLTSGARAPSVVLLSRPEQVVSGVCRQETYHVDLPLGRGTHPSMVQSAIVQWTDIAIADSCETLDPNARFARIQPQATEPIQAARGLEWLKHAVQGKGSAKPKFTLKCASNLTPNGCTGKPEQVFSNLSFGKLFLIEKANSNTWNYIFAIYDPGGPIWKVSVADMQGPNPTITMTESVPAPF